MASFRVTYKITTTENENLDDKLRKICLEQSAELPDDVIPPKIRPLVVGYVVQNKPINKHQVLAQIAWPLDNLGNEVHQLINLLFGNISLQQGIQIVDMEWNKLNQLLAGPRFGITGIRSGFHIYDRPLSATALKPVGYNIKQLAKMCYKFAFQGIDIIKDDHNLANQKYAPYEQRVRACVQMVNRAADKTGKKARYFANVTGDYQTLLMRAETAAKAGVDGIMLAPHICGLPVLAQLREADFGLPIIAHPAFSGTFFTDGTHGLAPPFLIGGLWRALGADFVIYPNVGGRFTFSEKICNGIACFARNKHIPFRQAFPMPGGGIQRDNIRKWMNRYGEDVVLLIGGSLHQHPKGPGNAAREIQQVIESG